MTLKALVILAFVHTACSDPVWVDTAADAGAGALPAECEVVEPDSTRAVWFVENSCEPVEPDCPVCPADPEKICPPCPPAPPAPTCPPGGNICELAWPTIEGLSALYWCGDDPPATDCWRVVGSLHEPLSVPDDDPTLAEVWCCVLL